MTGPSETFPQTKVRPIRGEKFLCDLNRFLPLGRKYHHLLRLLNGQRGLLAIPFGPYRVLKPAAWTKSVTAQLLAGGDVAVEFQLLEPFCRQCQSGHLIDVGANIGLYTLLFRAASSLPIIAYEPQPYLFKLLQWNIAYNRLPAVQARNLACGARRGEVSFMTGLNGAVVLDAAAAPCAATATAASSLEEEAQRTAQGGVMKLPVTTLDEDLAKVSEIALLKIDCEGFEYQILQGAREILKRHRPFLFVEVHPEQLVQFGQSTQALLDLLTPGYDLEFWYFQIGRHASKLQRSVEKFRRPRACRCATVQEMLAASTRVPGPAQIYFVGRPKPAPGGS
jgi:FkbM family methyltransferase